MDDREEDLRESNMFRSSDPNTDKSSIGDFQKSKNGMIVERNDRFIIFKMVVSILSCYTLTLWQYKFFIIQSSNTNVALREHYWESKRLAYTCAW